MNEIIAAIAQKLNLPEASVRNAARSLLNFAREKVGGPDFENLVSKIPGASELLSEPTKPSTGEAGGLLGGLLGAAGGLLGGQTADLARVAVALESAGIPADRVMPFAQEFFREIRESVGPEVLGRLAENFPALKNVILRG